MMTREHLAGLLDHAQAAYLIGDGSELAGIVTKLAAELERCHIREGLLRSEYQRLLGAARATIAADNNCEPAPLTHLRWVLGRHGQLPADGQSALHVLADASATRTLADRVTDHTHASPNQSSVGIEWECRTCGTAMITPGLDAHSPESGQCLSCRSKRGTGTETAGSMNSAAPADVLAVSA
ncbi:hypothetical protein J5X84_02300 [Streptosporangiaceae bacterium NEAU-GS5]|nr:hypothetical protein [Streptosporangiaceae bacterium NEAU-GS5]